MTFHTLWLLEKYSDNSINSDSSCDSLTLRSHCKKNVKRCIKWAQTVEVDSCINLFYRRLHNLWQILSTFLSYALFLRCTEVDQTLICIWYSAKCTHFHSIWMMKITVVIKLFFDKQLSIICINSEDKFWWKFWWLNSEKTSQYLKEICPKSNHVWGFRNNFLCNLFWFHWY